MYSHFQALINALPGRLLVLAPDAPRFTVLGASPAFLEATRATAGDIEGRGLFELLAEAAQDGAAGEVEAGELCASLERALSHRGTDTLELPRYLLGPLPLRGLAPMAQRWRMRNTPVLDGGGAVRWLIHDIEDAPPAPPPASAPPAPRREGDALHFGALFDPLDDPALHQEVCAAAFTNNPAAIALTRLDDGTVLDVNDTWLAMTGTSRAAMVGRSVRELWSSDRDARRFLGELLRQGTVRGWEQAFRRSNGDDFVVQISAQVLTVRGERTVLSTLVDVTARKQAQAELQALNATLERRVAERTAELAAARDAAEAANRAKSTFLAHMSHEIRTPLNAVIGLSQLMSRMALPERALVYAGHVSQAGEQLLALTNDVLDLSRIEAGEVHLERVPLAPHALLQAVCAMVQPQADAKGLALRLEASDDLPPQLLGDPLRLKQVLLNLLGNAVKFTEQGSVTLRVRELARVAGCCKLRLDVIDTGIGIAAEAQQRVFDPFIQADSSTTRRFGGTGLGLSIVQRLVDMMGGQLALDSAPGRGSTFSVVLILDRPEGAAAAPAASAADAAP
ncbi:sensor histidine kinase [Azohydromonas aeria]|uniref:sensor histidine kinase n=1 Tax=Azohydromonas aeria TaxID=2590212 RepID=UPI0012F734B6|nr:ATP-binding protein [Azohydromonas aeria]